MISEISKEEVNINFWDEDNVLQKKSFLVIHFEKDTRTYLKAHEGKIDTSLSARYKRDIYHLKSGEILAFLNEPLKFGVVANTHADWNFFKTRMSAIKFDIADPIFCVIDYIGINKVNFFIRNFKGRLLEEYSNEDERLYLLSNGNYAHIERIFSLDKMDIDFSIHLYNSIDDVNRFGLFLLLEERTEKIANPDSLY